MYVDVYSVLTITLLDLLHALLMAETLFRRQLQGILALVWIGAIALRNSSLIQLLEKR